MLPVPCPETPGVELSAWSRVTCLANAAPCPSPERHARPQPAGTAPRLPCPRARSLLTSAHICPVCSQHIWRVSAGTSVLTPHP